MAQIDKFIVNEISKQTQGTWQLKLSENTSAVYIPEINSPNYNKEAYTIGEKTKTLLKQIWMLKTP